MNFLQSAPPMPKDPAEARRVLHTRERRQIIYSMHRHLVEARIVQAVGPTRSKAWKIVDMTSNPAWYVASQLAGLHREAAEVTPPPGAEETAIAVQDAGYWQLAQRIQRDTIALNDMFVRVDIDPSTREPAFRLVPPDLCSIVSSPLRPSQPLAMKEWIPDPDDSSQWVQLYTDPRILTYQALDVDGVDVSRRVLDGLFVGDNYPFIVEGKPVLPYIAYHAAESGYALDPFSGAEVFEGALQLGVYYSFFGHILRQAAWGQRWAMGAEPVGGEVDEEGRRRDVIADPSTVTIFRQLEGSDGGSPQIGQFSPPVDPERILASVERYERRLVEMMLATVGVSRRDSDVKSAMSLAVDRETKREVMRAYEPVFKRSELAMLRLVAGLRGEPTQGWRLNYRSLPRDPAELAAELARMQGLIASGLLDKVSAYKQLHPGLSDSEAEQAVQAIAVINAKYAGGADSKPIALTSTDIASIVTVNEARSSQGLPGASLDGELTVSEYQAKHATVVAAAANAASGQPTPAAI